MPFVVKLDEDLSPKVEEPLTAAGYIVKTVAGQGLSGTKDAQLWSRVCGEGAYFVTADKGFSDIRRFPPGRHPGILVLRPNRRSVSELRSLVAALLSSSRLESLGGTVAVATPRGLRIRRAPGTG